VRPSGRSARTISRGRDQQPAGIPVRDSCASALAIDRHRREGVITAAAAAAGGWRAAAVCLSQRRMLARCCPVPPLMSAGSGAGGARATRFPGHSCSDEALRWRECWRFQKGFQTTAPAGSTPEVLGQPAVATEENSAIGSTKSRCTQGQNRVKRRASALRDRQHQLFRAGDQQQRGEQNSQSAGCTSGRTKAGAGGDPPLPSPSEGEGGERPRAERATTATHAMLRLEHPLLKPG